MGIAGKLRSDNPIDHELVPDVLFATTLTGWPLHRFVRPFVGAEIDERLAEGAEWTPQTRIEATLREHAESFASTSFLWEHTVTTIRDSDHEVAAMLMTAGGEPVEIRARYLVGCDGSHSIVREHAGVRLEGQANLLRAFKFHITAPLKAVTTVGLASFYWFVNTSFDAGASVLLNALDSEDGWGFSCYPVPEDVSAEDHEKVAEVLFAAVGRRVPVGFVSGTAWNMHALVAPRFRVGRIFLAGDAAHLMPNLGGFGMNSSLLDAVDLGWKLSAVLSGWGGSRLLDSYDAERRASIRWVVDQQVENASVLSKDLYRPGIESSSPQGDAIRLSVGADIARTKRAEFESLGMQKGYRYDDSPIILRDADEARAPEPAPDPTVYTPSARPGSVAPHRWLAKNHSIYDRFGPEYTLLRLGGHDPDPIIRAFAERRIPLTVIDATSDGLAPAYGADLALIRPDQHVAWRGRRSPADPVAVAEAVRGR